MENTPLDDQGNPKKKFQVMMRPAKNGVVEKAIFIDGELLDWSIDISSLMEARRMGPAIFEAAKKDIQKHFMESVSEVVGRHVTVEDLKQATLTGWI